MPMCNITGYLYNASGVKIETGLVILQLQQDMTYDGIKVVPYKVTVDLSTTAGYVDVTVYPTENASPAGISYKLEFDPDPTDTSRPMRQKDGYFRNFLNVPDTASESLGNIVSALRGQPAQNYAPLGGTAPLLSDTVTMGTGIAGNKRIIANNADVNKPEIRYNDTTNEWEFANDGVTFQGMLQGGGGSVGGDLSGSVGSATVTKIQGMAVSTTDPTTTGQVLRWNNTSSQWEPSLDASLLTGISATGMTTGTLPLARLVDIGNAQIAAAAAIAWTKISKTGSSIADLTTRSAADLSSGTLPLARLSGITNTEIDAAAAIAWSKVSKTGSSLADLTTKVIDNLSDVTITTPATGQLLEYNGSAWVNASPIIKRTTVILTDAQVKALPTTPVTLVAAPGAGFYVAWQSIELKTKFASGAYTNLNATYSGVYAAVNGASLSLVLADDSATTPPLTGLTSFAAAASKRVRLVPWLEGNTGYVMPVVASSLDLLSSVENQPLRIAVDNNGSGDLTGGNASNTLTVVVTYSIEAMP